MNKYVLIISMKPVFDCLDVTIRAKLRQTCKWCNKYIRYHLNKTGAQLIIRCAWYYYKLHKNLCVSSQFTPIENLKLLVTKRNAHKIANEYSKYYYPKRQGVERAISLLGYTNTYNFSNKSFEFLSKCGFELVMPVYNEKIERSLDIVKSCYIKLYGNHKNLIIDIVINSTKWLSASVPDNAIAVRIHFGLLPMCSIQYSTVSVYTNRPLDLRHRYLHGIILENDPRKNLVYNIEKSYINHKIFMEAFYPDGSRELIGKVIKDYLVYRGELYNHF
jgi:hypothetical protein